MFSQAEQTERERNVISLVVGEGRGLREEEEYEKQEEEEVQREEER